MAVRVTSNGKGETHVAATHYLVDPMGLLHIYTGDTHTATYRDWSSAVVSVGIGEPPREDSEPEPVPSGPVPPNITVRSDDGSVAAINVESVTLSAGKAKRKPRVSGMTVPRGGFGSKDAQGT